jgi:hypothetical protein
MQSIPEDKKLAQKGIPLGCDKMIDNARVVLIIVRH